MITHLNTVSVYVTDQDRALSFYKDALGFDVTADMGDENFRWLSVAPKGAQTHLVLIKATPEKAHWFSKIGKHTGFVFYTDNIQQTYEAFKAKGVHFPVEPKKQDWGGEEATFADQDGNRFELVQRPEWVYSQSE